jgi:PAS domain S-box-containing protein
MHHTEQESRQLEDENAQLRKRLAELEKNNTERPSKFYKALINKAPDGVVLLGENFRISYVSPAAERLFGYSVKELKKMSPDDLTHPDDLADVHKVLQHILNPETENFGTASYRFQRKDGEWRWIESAFTNLMQDPDIRGIVINFRDITDQVKTTEALQERDERFRTLFNQGADIIFVCELKPLGVPGKIIEANENAIKLLGYSMEELKALSPMDIAHPGDAKKFVAIAKQFLAEKKALFETKVRRKNGVYFPVEIGAEIIRYGEEDLLISTARDISARYEMQIQLRESEERFRSIFENATIGLYRSTPDGRILMANPALLDMLGYASFEELAQRDLNKDGFDPQYERSTFIDRIERDGKIVGLEAAWISQSGKQKFVRESARAIKDTNGKTLYYEGTIEDITEKKRAEQEREEYLTDILLVNTVNRAANSGADMREILRIISEKLKDILFLKSLSIYLLSDDEKFLKLHTLSDMERYRGKIESLIQVPIPDVYIPLDQSAIAREFLNAKQPVLLSSRDAVLQWIFEFTKTPQIPAMLQEGVRKLIPQIYKITKSFSIIIAPLFVEGKAIGLLEISREEAFCETDLERVALVANQLTPTIRRIDAERAIRRLSRVFEETINEIYLFDVDTLKFLQVNNASISNLGYTADELKELTPLDIKPEFTLGSFQDLIKPLLTKQKNEIVFETVHQRKNKTFYDVEVHLQILDHEDEKLIAAIILDITERKKTEEQLQASEEKYKALFDGISDAAFVHVLQDEGFSNFIEVNETACQRLGYSRDELLSMSAADISLTEDVLRRGSRDVRQHLRDEKWQIFEITHIAKNGDHLPVEISSRSFEMNGKTMVVSLARDISERLKARNELQRYVQRINSLRKIDQAIINSFDLRVTLSIIIDYLISELQVDAAAILKHDESTHALIFVKGQGFRTKTLQDARLRVGRGYAGKVALERQSFYIPNLATVDFGISNSPDFQDEKFISYYGVPLISKGILVGVLEVFNRSPLEPDREWVNYIEMLAGQAAIAIDNIALFEDLERTNIRLVQAYDATIEGWAQALELRDAETEGHSRRVVEITLALAKMLGISNADLIHIRRGALLHDIGKMGVSDKILQKPGKLTDEEWAIMKKHPVLAHKWLASIEYLRPALDIPYCHHEKWDGTGYPRGLEKEQIPIAARIFAIVDVWDALRSDRPYRKAWSRERALTYIKEQSGTHFDPRVATTFLRYIENEKESR